MRSQTAQFFSKNIQRVFHIQPADESVVRRSRNVQPAVVLFTHFASSIFVRFKVNGRSMRQAFQVRRDKNEFLSREITPRSY